MGTSSTFREINESLHFNHPSVDFQFSLADIRADVSHVHGLPRLPKADHGGEERAEPELHGPGPPAGSQRVQPALVRLGAFR